MKEQFLNICTKYLANESSETENQWLFDLLQEHPEYSKMFEEISSQCNVLENFEYIGFDESKAREKIFKNIQRERQKQTKFVQLKFFKIAAAILVLLGMFSVYTSYNNSQDEWKTFATNKKQQLEILLPDSTEVWLNKNSQLKYNFGDQGQRNIKLIGEAFFKVKRDTLRPFVVYTHGLKTKVLGTSFNINASTPKEAVSVISGKVAVFSKEGETLFLRKGDRVRLDTVNLGLVKDYLPQIENVIAWKQNEYKFDHITLEHALKYFSDNYGYSFEYSKETIKQCSVRAYFKNQSLKTMMNIICASLDCSYVIDYKNKTIKINGNGC